MYALIMASGQGTRLWPLSRSQKPKQFHPLVSEKTLLRETFDRVRRKFPIDKIFVAVTEQHYKIAKKELPELPRRNFIVEPFAVGTAATIGLATTIINQHDPKAEIVCLPCDHLMKKPVEFIAVLDFAEQMINEFPEEIIQIGIKPSFPDTGLGYIEYGDKKDAAGHFSIYRVKRFVEKPDLETARDFVTSGKFLWNAGIYIFKASYLKELYEKYLPKTAAAFTAIAKSLNGYTTEMQYKNIDAISIDYGIIEKMKNILVIPADFGWSDIGNWGTLLEKLSQRRGIDLISTGHHLDIKSRNCLVISDERLVATVGLKDIIIINTPDALLVCNKNDAQEITKIIDKLKADKREQKYL